METIGRMNQKPYDQAKQPNGNYSTKAPALHIVLPVSTIYPTENENDKGIIDIDGPKPFQHATCNGSVGHVSNLSYS